MIQDKKQAVFTALADEHRRTIIELLIEYGEMTATQLAELFPITRQGVTKHLNILAEAGLLTMDQRGRDKFYRLRPEPLEEAALWIAAIAARWDQRLANLRDLVEIEIKEQG